MKKSVNLLVVLSGISLVLLCGNILISTSKLTKTATIETKIETPSITAEAVTHLSKIPKIFHQVFIKENDPTTVVPELYGKYIKHCRDINKEWKYYFWRDNDAEKLLNEHYPQYAIKYKQFKHRLQKSDFLRYIVLSLFGGVYLDMDVECVKPFSSSSILMSTKAFLDQERNEQSQYLHRMKFNALNSGMGGIKGHPFFLEAANRCLLSDSKSKRIAITTGPYMLTKLYLDWQNVTNGMQRMSVTLLQPHILSPYFDMSHKEWFENCKKYKKYSTDMRSKGCQTINSKDWKVDIANDETVARHKFLHFGWFKGIKATFNVRDNVTDISFYAD